MRASAATLEYKATVTMVMVFMVSDTSTGVYATSNSGYAALLDGDVRISGSLQSYNGMIAENQNGTGVFGTSTSGGDGVYGSSFSIGNGVSGYSYSGNGIYDKSITGHAALLDGNVQINGQLTKSSGQFKIDHPLDPANKYLCRSFVESSDMKNVYDGVVALDDSGEAVIELPDWFGVLNNNNLTRCKIRLTQN